MNRKAAVVWISLAMMLGFVVIMVEIAPKVEAPTTLYVGGAGSGNYSKIQWAIDNASNGDTVFVYNGTYYENVVVDRSISLIGEDRNNTIIDGSENGDVVNVYADWVNITGFKVTGSRWSWDDTGIELTNVQNCRIIDNNVSNNYFGITLYYSNRTIISKNTAWYNWHGIRLEDSNENNITDNNAYLCSQESIILIYSDGNTVRGNSASHDSNEGNGIYIGSSNKNTVVNNTFLKQWQAIYMEYSNDNHITENNALYSKYGIRIHGSDNNVINQNTFISNLLLGILFDSSSDNSIIYHNNIINNADQASDNGVNNQWDNGYPLGGNYWSDYTGVDKFKGPYQNIPDKDGIGDTPYTNILGGAGERDNYPLMWPYKPLENITILKQGWNLISIPLIQEELNLTRVLGSTDGWYDAVEWYNTTDTNDYWKVYKVGKPFGNDLSEINETMGFWIHITKPGDTIFLYNGTTPTQNQTITLHPGWNLVGYPSLSRGNRTEAMTAINFGSDVDSIWTFDATTQRWKELGEKDYFEIGRGYWIHSKVEITWEVPL